ncbi:LPS assembly lipoprotein LptE [Paucibacter sp. APW11]|uniref:LPS-assembly lipoprotein LptE n=1 Tax=Roseateles aquae TaxID=3077235 RepID=A0ABU3PA49_9BURK|nr:LPS assembly lipoprotein LptE [Paucibacter sp. APW11]MDT8999451.1 LPS assembly lipoprotein LptE [Paucibacter sp. APW11]
MTQLSRRQALGLASSAALLLAGCGFELRREPELQFKTLALQGFQPASPLTLELRRQIERSTVQLLDDPNRADVVLEARRDTQRKTQVVPGIAGQVREWQLRLELDYLVRTPAGEILLPRTELLMTRDMNYAEGQALAKEQEELQLFRAMQYDAAAQVMRRLAAVRLKN